MNSEQYYIDLKDPTKQEQLTEFYKSHMYMPPLSFMTGIDAYYFVGDQYSIWLKQNKLDVKYPKEFESYYKELEKNNEPLGLFKLNPTYYKKLSYENWLADKQSTEEFELWWNNNYKNKLSSTIIELSFKEVAKSAWDEQEKNIAELYEKINNIKDELKQLISGEDY